MTVDDLLGRVRARGGEIRLIGSGLQYRPATALTAGELCWLRRHEGEAITAFTVPDANDRDAFKRWLCRRYGGAYVRVGDAGPRTPAWARMTSALS
jgi:hypothetical protein